MTPLELSPDDLRAMLLLGLVEPAAFAPDGSMVSYSLTAQGKQMLSGADIEPRFQYYEDDGSIPEQLKGKEDTYGRVLTRSNMRTV